jgi:DNA-binding transcriptional MerR regulator
MSTKEAKEKLDRLRARRGGHRGVSTKLMKEAMELLQTPEAENIERCEIIAAQRKGDINREVKIPRFTGTGIAILFTNFC